MPQYFVTVLLYAALASGLTAATILFFPTINKRLGTKRMVKAVVKGKSLEDQQYTFTPTEADISRHGNNLVYRLFVEVEGKTYDLLTNPKGYLATKVGQSMYVCLYNGRYFGKTYVEWR